MASSSQPSPQRPSDGSNPGNENPTLAVNTAKSHNDEMPSAAVLLEIGAKSLQTGAATGNHPCNVKQSRGIANWNQVPLVQSLGQGQASSGEHRLHSSH